MLLYFVALKLQCIGNTDILRSYVSLWTSVCWKNSNLGGKKGSRKFKRRYLDYHEGFIFVVLLIKLSGIFTFWLSWSTEWQGLWNSLYCLFVLCGLHFFLFCTYSQFTSGTGTIYHAGEMKISCSPQIVSVFKVIHFIHWFTDFPCPHHNCASSWLHPDTAIDPQQQ